MRQPAWAQIFITPRCGVPSDASRGGLTIALPARLSLRLWLRAGVRFDFAERVQTVLVFVMRSKTAANIPGTMPISLLRVRARSSHRFA